jgi:addiction module RelE/StbE family toxin
LKLFWTAEAEADRNAIYDDIEPDNPRAAVELDRQFERRAAQLVAHPMIGRVGRVENTRELVVRPNYLLIYDVEGDTIRILRVLHAARQWPPEVR